MFRTKSIFDFFMKKKDCVVQALLGRCIMSLEMKESSTSVIVIHAKGTIFHFTLREFVLVTGLNCVINRDDFVFDEERPNRIIDQYFDEAVPGAASHNEDDIDSDDDFQDPPQRQKQLTKKKKHHVDSSASPAKKKLKPHPKGTDKQPQKRTPPPHTAKMPSSPALSSFSFEAEDVVVSKKVIDKFRDKKQAKDREYDQPPTDENVNNTSSLQATLKFDHEFNQNLEGTLNTKSIDESIGEAEISESQFTFSDGVLRSIDLDFINKANAEVKVECKTRIGSTLWVLLARHGQMRCIYVYDSLSAAGYDVVVLSEIEKLAKVIPICLIACKFYENKSIEIDNHPNYKLNDRMDPFGISVVENMPQQPSDSLDCGLYMVTYAECLIFGEGVSSADFDQILFA
ncbi:hypothetical protein FXO38_05196 [Capsicum annuum]|nr:hypothetical protein FXO38_05196 [Capsicum annuum]